MLKSWDIFDTLIARRCIFPQNIFRIVEQISKVTNFTNARVAAEQNVARRIPNYTPEDIYTELKNMFNVSQELCDKLKSLEIQTEIDQCIPITENLRQVKAGDILISDMYLPEKVIRKMLDKAGLFAPVEIVITSGGKSSGRIWQELADQGKFIFHIGDNLEVDVKKPREYGFDSAISIISQPNQFEQWLMQRDFKFAAYLREIRLKNPFTEEIKQTYWTIFTINMGILIILVQLIDKLQKKYGFEYLGFCGRDTYWLRLLYNKYKADINENPVDNDYLHYSRKLTNRSEKEMKEYFSSRIAKNKALMIDLVGTGVHLNNLRVLTNLDYSLLICFLMGNGEKGKEMYPDAQNFSKQWTIFNDNVQNGDISETNFTFLGGESHFDFFEFINRSTHNTPIRLNAVKIGNKIIPEVIYSEYNDTENFDVLETCAKETLNSRIEKGRGDIPTLLETLKGMLNFFFPLADKNLLKARHNLNL